MPGVCPRCLREVYFAEEKLALGKVWHNFCFSCRNCRKLLDSWTVATHSGELYCRNCHNRLFPTKSVRPTLPSVGSPIFPSVDIEGLAVSLCGSLTDCCCCCYCSDECDLIEPRSGDEKLSGSPDSPEAKQRLRGGGGEDEEVEANVPLDASGTKQDSDNEGSQLDAQSFVTTLCDPPLSPTAVTAWHNRHHSASQSTISRPSSAQRSPIRPSSTPAAGESAAAREVITCHCLGNRRPRSLCRTNHKHHGYSKRCQRHFCRDFQRADKIVGSQERGKFVKDYRGGNFVANYRNLQRLQPNHHLGVSSPFTKALPSFAIQSHHKTRNFHQTTKNLTTIDPLRRKSSYPPLPPDYSPPLRRRTPFDSTPEFPVESQVASPAMQKIVDSERTDVDIITFEHSAYQEQPNISEGHFSSFPTKNILNIDDPEDAGSYEAEYRLRGGCGGSEEGSGCCCSSAHRNTNITFDRRSASPCNKRYHSDRSSTVEGACGCSGSRGRSECGAIGGGCCGSEGQNVGGHSPRIGGHASMCGSERHRTGFETCPPHPPDPCSSNPANYSPCSDESFSDPCSGRKGCCPPAGCRPVRRRIARCNTPCMGDMQSCGGGGCCGGGCRGGCGKPGQTCLPLKPCATPPCKSPPRCGGSPCAPPRGCSPQPPCCRSPVLPRTPGSMSGSGGSSCYRSGSPGGRSCGGGGCSLNQGYQQQDVGFGIGCQPKLPSGCECLGGGQDCQRCGRKVYQAEMQIASGVPYHNICFSCFCCRKPLETLTYHENCGEIYCKQCYVRNFGPQGYGYAGVLQTPM